MWFWLNIPLAALFFTATAGIPMWMMIKHPDTAPDFGAAPQPAEADTRARAAQVALAGPPTLLDGPAVALTVDDLVHEHGELADRHVEIVSPDPR